MKKLISILMLLAILLSCCACAAEEAPETSVATQATEATQETTGQNLSTRFPTWEEMEVIVEEKKTEGQATPEEMYGMINQLEPIGGVYKVWSVVGVQNMADHPDGKFELLCNIDM